MNAACSAHAGCRRIETDGCHAGPGCRSTAKYIARPHAVPTDPRQDATHMRCSVTRVYAGEQRGATMDERWRRSLWQQFGAAIAMLAQPIRACPDELWQVRLWDDPYAEFWNIGYHALFWLDLYLG